MIIIEILDEATQECFYITFPNYVVFEEWQNDTYYKFKVLVGAKENGDPLDHEGDPK